MSRSQKFWDFLFPVTSALSMCMSCCSSTLCQVTGNQHDLDDSASISTIESFYTPIPPPSLPPSRLRPISFTASSISSDVSNASSQSPVSLSRPPPRLLTHPFYVVLNEDILLVMFSLMDPIALGRCARVCKLWWHLATSVLWTKDVLSIGMHPLLGYIDTYYLDPPLHPVSTFFISMQFF